VARFAHYATKAVPHYCQFTWALASMKSIIKHFASLSLVILLIGASIKYGDQYHVEIFFTIVFIVITGLIWFGHKSAWGKIHYEFSIPQDAKFTKLGNHFINADIVNKNKRIGGIAYSIFLCNKGILFKNFKLLNFITPPVFIPWGEVEAIEVENTDGFLHMKRTKLALRNHSVSILLPKGKITDALLDYINVHEINF
jgi:hypothetical protein